MGRSGVQGSQLHSKFQDSLGYLHHFVKENDNNE